MHTSSSLVLKKFIFMSTSERERERELFYDDIRYVLQSTIDLRINYGHCAT